MASGEAQEISKEQIRVEKITEHHKDILGTLEVCDNEDENDLRAFLMEDALNQQVMEISTTYLWFYNPTNELLGYVTLLTDAIRIHGTNLSEKFRDHGVSYKTLPAIKMGRLCISKKFRRRGVGRKMVVFSTKKLLKILDVRDPKVDNLGNWRELDRLLAAAKEMYGFVEEDKGEVTIVATDGTEYAHNATFGKLTKEPYLDCDGVIIERPEEKGFLRFSLMSYRRIVRDPEDLHPYPTY